MKITAWLMQYPKRWSHLRHVPLNQLTYLLLAIFLIFSTIGFFLDLINGGTYAYAIVFTNVIFSGVQAVAWLLVLARLPYAYIFGMAVLQTVVNVYPPSHWVQRIFHPAGIHAVAGIHFASWGMLLVTLGSYLCFVIYIQTTGKEARRVKTELDLAHSIQKTLVPIISRSTPAFQIYGISEPSEKVGGDLVDVVELEGGDTIAYLADIAGHGLQAGILMGMLKTAARTALLDGSPGSEQGATLSMLMERLNEVLPGVKESHMYATFTAVRLNLDGRTFYGMAASPPLLLWSAARRQVARIEQSQFPLALLPVTGFAAYSFAMDPGDLALVATDGIIEVSTQDGTEFGVEALEALLMAEAKLDLPELAASILRAVRSYGKQLDDQTLLLVRRHPA